MFFKNILLDSFGENFTYLIIYLFCISVMSKIDL